MKNKCVGGGLIFLLIWSVHSIHKYIPNDSGCPCFLLSPAGESGAGEEARRLPGGPGLPHPLVILVH